MDATFTRQPLPILRGLTLSWKPGVHRIPVPRLGVRQGAMLPRQLHYFAPRWSDQGSWQHAKPTRDLPPPAAGWWGR